MNALYPLTRRLAVVLVGVLALIGSAGPAHAQSCTTGTAEVDLDVNNVRATQEVLHNLGMAPAYGPKFGQDMVR